MYARSAVKPECRLVHDPTLHTLSSEGGQTRLGVHELSPGCHDRRSVSPYLDRDPPRAADQSASHEDGRA